MQLIFNSETDALSVVEQLYNFERVGKILIAESIDFRALELAVSLAQVTVRSLILSGREELMP